MVRGIDLLVARRWESLTQVQGTGCGNSGLQWLGNDIGEGALAFRGFMLYYLLSTPLASVTRLHFLISVDHHHGPPSSRCPSKQLTSQLDM